MWEQLVNIELFGAMVRLTTPLLLISLGALIVWRAGIINLALEGFILLGALSATLGTLWADGSLLIGFTIAVLTCALLGIALAVAIVSFGANQIVTGIAFNIGMLGLTDYMSSVAPRMLNTNGLRTAIIPNLPLPVLSDVPVVGPVFFDQSPMFYFAVISTLVVGYVFKQTGIGIAIRAVGENARAADTAGISVSRIRFFTFVISCVYAGLAGAFLSIGYLGMFISGMSSGQGYIALVIVILGQWTAIGTLFAALLFGLAQALVVRWPSNLTSFPIELITALPYILTLGIVALVSKARGPEEEGIHYIRGKR